MLEFSLSGPELFLVAVWFGVALWNTSVGPTGGVTFATMASILPPTAVIPIQAVVESASSVFRVILLRDFVDLRFLFLFMIGGSVGFLVGLGARTFMPPSDAILQIIMGSFILLTTWVPISKLNLKSEGIPWIVGLATSFASLFIGGVAALIAAAIDQKHRDHGEVIATMTASLIYQHSIKVIIFGMLGFSFAAYADLMIAMFIAAIAGTWLGKRILVNVPQHIIKTVFKLLVTCLGVKVLADGLGSLS